MLTFNEKIAILMTLNEKVNRLRERRQYYIFKRNTTGLSSVQEDIFTDLEEEIRLLESAAKTIDEMEVKKWYKQY